MRNLASIVALSAVTLGGCAYTPINYSEMWENHLDTAKVMHVEMDGLETVVLKEGWKETKEQTRREVSAYFSRNEQEALLYLKVTDGVSQELIEEIAVRNGKGIEIFQNPKTAEMTVRDYELGDCLDESGCIYGACTVNWFSEGESITFPDWKQDDCYSPIGKQQSHTWKNEKGNFGGRDDVVAFTYAGLLDFRETHQWFVTANGEKKGRRQTNRDYDVEILDSLPQDVEARVNEMLEK